MHLLIIFYFLIENFLFKYDESVKKCDTLIFLFLVTCSSNLT